MHQGEHTCWHADFDGLVAAHPAVSAAGGAGGGALAGAVAAPACLNLLEHAQGRLQAADVRGQSCWRRLFGWTYVGA